MDLGPAALARRTEVVRVGGLIRGAGQRKAAAVNARRVMGQTLGDRMHDAAQLSDRQHAAWCRLYRLWIGAGHEQRTVANYRVAPEWSSDDDLEALDGGSVVRGDRDTMLREHRDIMRKLPPVMAMMLDAACAWQPGQPSAHPGTRMLATFQAALDALADHWEIARAENDA